MVPSPIIADQVPKSRRSLPRLTVRCLNGLWTLLGLLRNMTPHLCQSSRSLPRVPCRRHHPPSSTFRTVRSPAGVSSLSGLHGKHVFGAVVPISDSWLLILSSTSHYPRPPCPDICLTDRTSISFAVVVRTFSWFPAAVYLDLTTSLRRQVVRKVSGSPTESDVPKGDPQALDNSFAPSPPSLFGHTSGHHHMLRDGLSLDPLNSGLLSVPAVDTLLSTSFTLPTSFIKTIFYLKLPVIKLKPHSKHTGHRSHHPDI